MTNLTSALVATARESAAVQKPWPSSQEQAEDQMGRQLAAHPSQLLWVKVALVVTSTG